MTKDTTKPPAKKKPRDPEERIRKVAERDEIVERKLTQLEIEDKRMQVMVLLDDEERIEEKAKEAAKNFASQLKTNQLQRNELRRTINAGRARETVTVEEYLNGRNEIVRINKATGEPLRRENGEPQTRTATARELQEDMFSDKRQDQDGAGTVQQNDAQPQGDTGFPSEFGGDPG